MGSAHCRSSTKHDQRGALGSLLDHRARVVDDAQAAVKDRPLRRRRQPQTAADGVQGFTRLLAVAAGAGHVEAGDRRHVDGVMNEAGFAAARGSLDHDHASLASRLPLLPARSAPAIPWHGRVEDHQMLRNDDQVLRNEGRYSTP